MPNLLDGKRRRSRPSLSDSARLRYKPRKKLLLEQSVLAEYDSSLLYHLLCNQITNPLCLGA